MHTTRTVAPLRKQVAVNVHVEPVDAEWNPCTPPEVKANPEVGTLTEEEADAFFPIQVVVGLLLWPFTLVYLLLKALNAMFGPAVSREQVEYEASKAAQEAWWESFWGHWEAEGFTSARYLSGLPEMGALTGERIVLLSTPSGLRLFSGSHTALLGWREMAEASPWSHDKREHSASQYEHDGAIDARRESYVARVVITSDALAISARVQGKARQVMLGLSSEEEAHRLRDEIGQRAGF
jgi:hypothetical protein